MTLEGASIYVCLARSDFCGRRLPTPRPGWPPTDPGRGCQTRGALAWPPPVASPRSGNISCPRPHPQLPGGSELASQPGQRSQLPQLAFLLARAGEGPVWLREAMGEPRRRAPREVAWEPQGSGKAGTNWRRSGTPLPFLALPARLRGCPGAAGLSRRCLPTQLPMLVSQPVPMHRRRRASGCSTLLPRTAASPGQRLPQPDIGSAWNSLGARSARSRLHHKLCGPGEREVARPGGPATVTGQRAARLEGWREGADTAAATPGSLRAPSWGRPPGACHSPA